VIAAVLILALIRAFTNRGEAIVTRIGEMLVGIKIKNKNE